MITTGQILPQEAVDAFRSGLKTFYGGNIASRLIERMRIC